MTFQMYRIPAMIMPLCMGITLGCPQRNISCNDIKTSDGFKFQYDGPEGSEIFVHYNETVIAHAVLGNQSFTYFNEVMKMDSHSVITRDCRDLHVKCIVPYGKRYVKETCVNYKITEKIKNPGPSDLPTQWPLIIGAPFGVLIVIMGLLCCLLSWIKKLKLSEIPSAPEPRGSGENDIEEDDTLGSVHVHSIDPQADGKTPQSLSLDRNLSNEEIQPPKSGDTSTPDANNASNHRAMHRNLRDDPGGVNDNKGKDIVRIREMHNGRTLVDGGPEDHENEGQPLLSIQRAAIQVFDMTGEAGALVNKRGFARSAGALLHQSDTDVESTPNMKP